MKTDLEDVVERCAEAVERVVMPESLEFPRWMMEQIKDQLRQALANR